MANMLRSQQMSLDLLLAAEQARTVREESTGLGTTAQPNVEVTTSLSTSPKKIMLENPSSLGIEPSELPGSTFRYYRDSPPTSPTGWRSSSQLAHGDDFSKKNLKSLYPVLKERILGDVDNVFKAWTRDDTMVYELSEDSAPPAVDPSRPKASAEDIAAASENCEALVRLIEGCISREEKLRNDCKVLSEKRLKIEFRLQKRKNGWLEIDDAALHRLETEVKTLSNQESDCTKRIEECQLELTRLASQRDKAMALLTSMTVPAPKISNTAKTIRTEQRVQDPSSTVPLVWNIEQGPLWLGNSQYENADSDTEDFDPTSPNPQEQTTTPQNGSLPESRRSSKPEYGSPTATEAEHSSPKTEKTLCVRQAFKHLSHSRVDSITFPTF